MAYGDQGQANGRPLTRFIVESAGDLVVPSTTILRNSTFTPVGIVMRARQNGQTLLRAAAGKVADSTKGHALGNPVLPATSPRPLNPRDSLGESPAFCVIYRGRTSGNLDRLRFRRMGFVTFAMISR